MEFVGQTILVYLEEDNIQRAFFRIRPLLTQKGPAAPQDIASLPDEGFLRIVPDKNEQHTFKERMRTIVPLCTLNLSEVTPEANKIRTNKNYSPARGEMNQFIVYSDAVQALREDLVYEVISADKLQEACTPRAYARSGGKIEGPFDTKTGEPVGEAKMLPPDSEGLYAVTLPGGAEKLFYWPQPAKQAVVPAPAAAPAPKPFIPAPVAKPFVPAPVVPAAKPFVPVPVAPAAKPFVPAPVAPIVPAAQIPAPAPVADAPAPEEAAKTAQEQIEELNRMFESRGNRLQQTPARPVMTQESPAAMPAQENAEDTRKVGGTPLYRTVARREPTRGVRNPLSEVVDHQMRTQKYEAPGAVLPQNAVVKKVDNPMDIFRDSLRGMWSMQEMQKQVLDSIIKLPGMQAMLSQTYGKQNDAVMVAMQAQMQDLEAERLSILMQIDEAKGSLDKARKDALEQMTRDERSRQDRLHNETELARKSLEKLDAQREKLNAQRDALLKEIEEAQNKLDIQCAECHLAPQVGSDISANDLCDRVKNALRTAGVKCAWDDAVNLLTLYAVSPAQMQLVLPTASDAADAAHAFAMSLGAAYEENTYGCDVAVYEGGDAPAMLCVGDSAGMMKPAAAYTCLIASEDRALERLCDETYSGKPWPVVRLEASDAWETLGEVSAQAPVKAACIKREMLKNKTEIKKEALELLKNVDAVLREAGHPLPASVKKNVLTFVSSAASLMEGGVAAALDYAVADFIVPFFKLYHQDASAVKQQLIGLARTGALLYQ